MSTACAALTRCRCGAPASRRLVLVALSARLGPDLSDPICLGCYTAEGWQPDDRDVALSPRVAASLQEQETIR